MDFLVKPLESQSFSSQMVKEKFISARVEKYEDGTFSVSLETEDVDDFVEWMDELGIDY